MHKQPIRCSSIVLSFALLALVGAGPTPASAQVKIGPGTVYQYGQDDGFSFLSDDMPAGEGPYDGVASCTCTQCNSDRNWVTTEFMIWWGKRRQLPPLVTSSPQSEPRATAGVIGQPGTTVLFGDERVDAGERFGGRVTVGQWLDDGKEIGIGGSFFALEECGVRYSMASIGDPILARPFFDTFQGQNAAALIAFPSVNSGSIDVHSASDVLGAEFFVRRLLTANCGNRLDLIGGYYFTRVDDGLTISSSTLIVDPGGLAAVGTTIDLVDVFGVRNEFHGGELGLLLERGRGCWTWKVLGKVSIGNLNQTVTVHGETVTTPSGGPAATGTGGLLARPSNSGTFERNEFIYVPEASVNLSRRLNEHLDVSLGYTFIYWSSILLAADQVDMSVNPNGGTSPAFTFNDTDFWVQGVNVGLEFHY